MGKRSGCLVEARTRGRRVVAAGIGCWLGLAGCGGSGGANGGGGTLRPDPGTIDEPIVVTADALSTPEDVPVAIDVLANDIGPAGVVLEVASVDPPSHGTARVLPDGNVLYTPEKNFHGNDEFGYEARGSNGSMASSTVRVEVLSVNDPPTATADSAVTNEDEAVTIDVRRNDTDIEGDEIVVVRAGAPGSGTALLLPNGLIEYTPEPDSNGTDRFEYVIADDQGAEAIGTVEVEVAPVDDPPEAADDEVELDEDTAVEADVLANDRDPDGGELAVVRTGAPSHGTIEILADSRLRYMPAQDFFGSDEVDYTIRDATGEEATARLRLTIAPVNDVPELEISVVPPEGPLSRGGNVEVRFLASDPDDPVRVDLVAEREGAGEGERERPVLIAGLEPAEGAAVALSVPTLAVPREASSFRIAGRVDDGFHEPEVVVAPELLTPTNVAWAIPLSSAREESMRALAILPDGRALVAGVARGTIRVGADLIVRDEDDDSPDAIIVRYSSDGAATAAWRAGGPGDDAAIGVAGFTDGSFAVCGYFEGDAVFDSGGVRVELAAEEGSRDLFVARYRADGSLAWARRGGGPDLDEAHAIAALPDGSVLVQASIRGRATLASSAGEIAVRARGASDVVVIRYGSAGEVLRSVLLGGTGSDEPGGIAAREDGSFAVTGYFESPDAIFGEDERAVTVARVGHRRDLFVARFDALGALQWVRSAGDERAVPGHEIEGEGVAFLPDGKVVITGSFAGGATFGVDAPFGDHLRLESDASLDVFLACFGQDGEVLWARRAGGPSSGDEGLGITALDDGSVVVCGSVRGEAVFGSGDPNETPLDSGDVQSSFVARWDVEGRLLWAKQSNGLGSSTARAIAAWPDGAVAIAGDFAGRVTFGAGDERETTLEAILGERDPGDAFIARSNADGGF